MGAFLVILPWPILCNFLQFRKGLEQVEVHGLFPVGLVEPLNVRILCGLAWLDEPQCTPFFSAQSASSTEINFGPLSILNLA